MKQSEVLYSMIEISTVLHALKISLVTFAPLLALWNIIILLILVFAELNQKRMNRFCERAIKTTAEVNKLIKIDSSEDSPSYYSSYIFYAENGEPFTGSFVIDKATDYQEGLSVTVFYDRNDPTNNVCEEQLAAAEKMIRKLPRMIFYGDMFFGVLMLLVFICQTVF